MGKDTVEGMGRRSGTVPGDPSALTGCGATGRYEFQTSPLTFLIKISCSRMRSYPGGQGGDLNNALAVHSHLEMIHHHSCIFVLNEKLRVASLSGIEK